jgi:hypothetical protein
MDVSGNYDQLGYLHVRELIPPEVARAFLTGIKEDLGPAPIDLTGVTKHGLQLRRPAFQIYGHDYRPMSFFLFALTPTISRFVGRDLLPAYDYFRIYRESDICRVHSDRPSCEHSVSLTLDYSDGRVWPLQVARYRVDSLHPLQEDFGDKDFGSVEMEVGDAVLYQGVNYAHGRTTPNPNTWSAHIFLHFVERGGPHEDEAFDREVDLNPVDFTFE